MNHPPYGTNHTYPESSYVRYHQTSGTTGRPLKILDTKQSWDWWLDCWMEVLRSAGVTPRDRVFLAFSFGPFIGFWAAYEAAEKLGALVIAGGGQSSLERLSSIVHNRATVLMCTPSYALHLAEVAQANNVDIRNSHVERLIHAGEPGASIPSVRARIESAWGGKCYDHAGMTEMGAYAYSCQTQQGLHVNERQFLAEIINPETLEPVADGETGELVLTNFGRHGFPLIRYRTGDLVVNQSTPCSCGNSFRFLPGGVVGRVDDMVVVRGVNIYPQSIESIVREFPEVAEFRIVYYTEQEMVQVKVQVEAPDTVLTPLMTRLRERVGLRIEVEVVEPGSLPRFEMKARRVLDLRNKAGVRAG
ncbi:phenylacetate--CoA ligase family protein [Alicyclobacillus cycloheptanicus]|uniref:Phenylacetate-CoA ligase n=1 Tax=Alicyclobacillus cycloheptanicus TaxID=1457 RepID=A0ABT9XIZ0_9BACL|nr:AMP-binding protein [Alicyclobacillus cycloheptanicus]MDQ0190266.1 phenylacetate-CoA ligase [Alicyclobacillus cycloheptanicus]